MKHQSALNGIDGLFNQVLNSSYGPVPEVVLYRLLIAVEGAIRQELARDESANEIAGLRLGYELGSGSKTEKAYWVGWGYHPVYEELIETDAENFENSTDITETDIAVDFLPPDLTKKLFHLIKGEMVRSTESSLLEGKALYPLLIGHVAQSAVRFTPSLTALALTENASGSPLSADLAFSRVAFAVARCNCTTSSGNPGRISSNAKCKAVTCVDRIPPED